MFAENIFPTFILVTTFFIFWFLFRRRKRLIAILCTILAAIITVISVKIAELTSNQTLTLGLFYLIELLILVTIVYLKNQEKKFDIHIKILAIFYLIIIIFCFLISRCSFNSSKKWHDYKLKEEKEINEYKSRFDFNVDSLALNIVLNNENFKLRKKTYSPIIFYQKDENGVKFDYRFNKQLDNRLRTFCYDSINTIVVLYYEPNVIGTYSNKKTKAVRTDAKIYFIDFKTREILNIMTLKGENPPPEVKYKGHCPETYSGQYPSLDYIIYTIKVELK